MKWTLKYLPEAVKDLKGLSGNQRIMVAKAIDKVYNTAGHRTEKHNI